MRNKDISRLMIAASVCLPLACGDDATTAINGGSDDSSTGAMTGPTTDPTVTPGTTSSADDSTTGDPTTGDPDSTGTDTDTEPACGDGTVDMDETCDDGNTADGDGCSATCEPEVGFDCDDSEPTVCVGVCGDGMVVGAEQCDDADNGNGDGCDDMCNVELGWSCAGEPSLCTTGCGDGIIAGAEGCDDSNMDDGDGCSARCSLETGWMCTGEPSLCTTECGDEMIIGPEECDDGFQIDGDGCSATCTEESGWVCMGEPSTCETQCGDGIAAGTETCDGGGIANGDGCTASCDIEFGWTCDMAVPNNCSLTSVFADVTLGGEGGCVLTTLGDVGCFGVNTEGQVGNGTVDVETFLPAFALAGASAISSGDEHVCAILGGDVWCWGDNANSQMGPASLPPADELMPLQITGLPANISQVEGGYDHTCAIDGVGSVWCWGDNDNRQLGQGGTGTTDDPNPGEVALPGGLTAIDLGLGENHSCAVLGNNTVACWGDDDGGQLGDGASGTDSGDATAVVGLTGIVDVEAGRDTTCALDNLGVVSCWGENADGEVGNDSTVDAATPVTVALPSAADAVSLGGNFSCALLATDQIFCWGEGSDYQLGYGDLIDQSLPVEVQGVPAGDVVDIEAGARGVCAIMASNERWCWGFSEEGQLGLAPLNQLEPTAPLSFSGPLASLALAPFEYRGVTCGVLVDGTVECAGDGTLVAASTVTGAAGFFSPITWHLSSPTPIGGLTDVQELDMGDSFICVRTSTNVLCWGDNSNRQLGQGGTSTTDILTATPVMGVGAVDQLETGSQFACVRTGGNVSCWGDNDNRQTSEDGGTTDQSLPVVVPGLADAVDLALGQDFACALRAGGVVSCWGDDGAGQLGDNDGSTVDSAAPVDVTGLPGAADQIAVGFDHGCALVAGEVWCWGDAFYGQLGQGNEIDSDTAVLVPGLPAVIVEIATGGNDTCAISDTGEMWCWGYSLDGQLGNGGEEVTGFSEEQSPVLFEVAGGINAVQMGNSHTCIDNGAGWQCVGFRSAGQLADGTSVEPAYPHPMFFGL
jgi:cysteine-rich repeat protein